MRTSRASPPLALVEPRLARPRLTRDKRKKLDLANGTLPQPRSSPTGRTGFRSALVAVAVWIELRRLVRTLLLISLAQSGVLPLRSSKLIRPRCRARCCPDSELIIDLSSLFPPTPPQDA